jgi:ferredoxin
MKIVVDLYRCQSYGQCVFAAPKVFRFHGEQSLEYDYNPDDELLYVKVSFMYFALGIVL